MSAWPSVLDALKSLQSQRKPSARRLTPDSKVGFALSTRDRFVYTMRTIKSLDADGEFDLIWNDGSEHNEVSELSRYFTFRNARLAELNYGVKGGADAAIRFGLRRLIELGYDFIGLIENDLLLAPGWFDAMRAAFDAAVEDNICVGAVSALGYQSRVLEYRKNYSIDWARGAALALFTREAAQLLLESYSRLEMTSQQIRGFYAEYFGVALHVPEWAVGGRWMDGPMTLDWGYAPLLYANGYASVGTIPSLARDLEFDVRTVLRTDYVRTEQNASGLAHPTIDPANIAFPADEGNAGSDEATEAATVAPAAKVTR
ncbi:MAG TPA: hypothetical protein VIH74_03535 [Candidatus Acidoferrum sp.]|jgi:hypothetical protein